MSAREELEAWLEPLHPDDRTDVRVLLDALVAEAKTEAISEVLVIIKRSVAWADALPLPESNAGWGDIHGATQTADAIARAIHERFGYETPKGESTNA